MTSRELVHRTLEFKNNGRVPRQLWVLPWAADNYPDDLKKIRSEFPDDILMNIDPYFSKTPKTFGDPYTPGKYIDEWGCIFENRQKGIIGEVKEPLIDPSDEGWIDTSRIHIPEEWLTINKTKINDFCKSSDKFILAGACPRIFEQLQFIRGTELLYIDLLDKPSGMFEYIRKMHDFYCRLLQTWAETDVDALLFMDDWGSQKSLLINPQIWIEIFKPMYKDYVDIGHKYNKKVFMHSDGFILDIIPHLIDIGLDALNSQIFCMGIDNLVRYKGYITFWGEIDRQGLLSYGSKKDIENAVASVKNSLFNNGGCIAQCEFGPGAKPENVYSVFKAWDNI